MAHQYGMRLPVFLVVIFASLWLCTAEAEDQPVVHMLVPGFSVQELPVRLSNVNNLRFAPDGRLFALAYDGHVHVLTDSDGDGLEDKDELYWDKPTISVPVGMALTRDGVYVSSHGKVSLLQDTDGDGKADSEEIVASGWPETDVGSGGVDAIGVTLDRNGDVYFGLITADYSNAYRVKDGVSHYDLHGMRGTIQRLARGSKKLETIATGIRVPYALAFNKAGDLFCTDQEGETWCPNGNPLDELNHIVRGRNYGFPPRHPQWLLDLVSEPPIVAFGPQHQSTCGMAFNEPHKGQGLFGPKWWEGNAFIAGESRGKIWRVTLTKTSHGYIGKEFLIARLSMLTTDVTISPRGDLYVCCHSGKPDWGTGPKGEGKIFKIHYSDPKAPQPIYAWAAGLTEVRVAFDKPIDASTASALIGAKIEFGEYVRAADRYEILKPPYKVVNQQEATPRGKLNIVGAHLQDGRTLALSTDPHPQPVTYALTLPGIKSPGAAGPGATVDVDYDLGGVLQPAELQTLTGKMPHGRQLAAALRSSHPPFAGLSRPPYPYIHPVVAENQTNLTLAGGDFERGRELFFGDQLKCSTCHRVRGEGKTTGPDLSGLISRDASSVLRDIKDPSASINPDFVAYNVSLKDGSGLTGFVRAQDEQTLRIIGADGKETTLARRYVEDLRPSSVSLMPSGLIEPLGETQVKDLLTFLLNAPPVRSRGEIEAAITSSGPATRNSESPLNLVLVASKQDHGPGQHDYPAWQKKWHPWLAQAPNVTVEDAWLWPSETQFQQANVVVFYYWNREWNSEKMQQLDKFLERGGGIVCLHSACIGNPDPMALADRIGLASESGKTKYLHTPVELNLVAPTNHAIIRGLPARIYFLDEPYWPPIGATEKVQVLGSVEMDGKSQPIFWKYEKGKGRVFGSIFGHFTWTWDDPIFQIIVLRGIAWAGGAEVNRFQNLVPIPTDFSPSDPTQRVSARTSSQ